MSDKVLADLKALQKDIRDFVRERGWEKFHTPQNISISLSLESAELLECFQWMQDHEVGDIRDNQKKISRIQDELADVFFCLLRMSDLLDIDLIEALKSKMKKNCEKYPIALVYGKADKYDDLRKSVLEVRG